MANAYVDSVGGSDTSPFDTWAKASNDLLAAIAVVSAGETVFVASRHTESATTPDLTGPGTEADLVRIVSATAGTSTYETMVAGGGKITITSTSTMPAYAVCEGLYFANARFEAFAGYRIFLDCKFDSTRWLLAGTSDAHILFKNCAIDTSDAADALCFGVKRGMLRVIGGSITGNADASLTTLVNFGDLAGNFSMEDCDMSGWTGSDYLATFGDDDHCVAKFTRCKFPTSQLYLPATPIGLQSLIAESCSNSNIIYQFHHEVSQGTVDDDTANYLAAKYDGTNGYSAKMVSNTNAHEILNPLRFKLADIWNPTANATVTVNVIHEGVGGGTAGDLQDDEFWIEVVAPDSTTGALGKTISSAPASSLATPADLTNNSEAWTEVLTGEVKQQAQVTLSGDQAGILTVWACLGKPSVTVYVDPKVVLS